MLPLVTNIAFELNDVSILERLGGLDECLLLFLVLNVPAARVIETRDRKHVRQTCSDSQKEAEESGVLKGL